jgi:bisphosphoglycerate-dependent phosphoglycerate mutase
MHQLAKFLTATGRRLRALGKVISHFSRKGKLGLKLAIKIPFFVEIEASFETDWSRRK